MIPSQEEVSTFPMVGDINLFLKGSPEEGNEEVEAEVMIAGVIFASNSFVHYERTNKYRAEAGYRRKGVALNALQILFHYATSPEGPPSLRIPPERLVARIGESNSSSLRLFEKLSFHVTRRVPVFQEVEMRYMGDGKWTSGTCIQFD